MPLVWIILVAIAARASLLFSSPYVPGVNGAYYLVQARALLERGTLGIPDMPLTFHLHAAIAWELTKVAGLPQSEAIVWAVKSADALLPPLVAWPVFVLVRRWARARGAGDAVPLAAAALACLASPWFLIVGELQKNSLALVWLAALAATLHAWLGAPTTKRGIAVLIVLLLLGLTHIGVMGAALLLLATVMLAFVAVRRGATDWRHTLPWIAAGTGVLAVTAAVVLWKYDPARIHRLMTALSNPSKFAADGRQGPQPPAGSWRLDRWIPWLGFAPAAIPALVIAWRRRYELPAADVAVAAGGACAVLVLTGPWFNTDKSMRLSLIALLPAIIIGAFAVLHIAAPWARRGVLAAALVIGGGSTVGYMPRAATAVLNAGAMRELQDLSAYTAMPESTLIVAPHGTEWWTAWFLGTRIAQRDAVRPADWTRYRRVLFLTVKPGAVNALVGRGPPQPPPGEGPGPGIGERRSGPPSDSALPHSVDAEVLHDGKYLTLVRFVAPPGFVRDPDTSLRSDAPPHPLALP